MNMRYEEPRIPRLVPKPLYCKGIQSRVIFLDGIWKVKHTEEPLDYIQGDYDSWSDIAVPSDMTAHRNWKENITGSYLYRTRVALPKEAKDSEYVLRFEGVNGFARVYIDGQLAMEHENAFVSFNSNITEYLRGKDSFELAVTVDEAADRVSAFNHGGILHSVMLYVLPENYYTSVHTTTTFDEAFQDGFLRIDYTVHEATEDYRYEACMISPDGEEVQHFDLPRPESKEEGRGTVQFTVPKPVKWDAEHPFLYSLKLTVWKGEEMLEETGHAFGFRQITRVENQLYVNGQEVKLRGACRHEITPLNGRCTTKELIEKDVALFKEANCNYIRTSHYPPSEYFLQLCDERGIYVEDELALAFIARTLPYTQRDPKETKRYLSHFSELVARDYSHPSVIIWSLCNESFGGYNFDLLNRYAHRIDPTRPTKFSYPMTMREEHEPVDIWSIHYSNLEEDLAKKCDNVSVGYTPGYDMPVLHDEYAHISCYNRTEIRRDPNVRNFWGESIKKFWDKIWNTKGALGGAIWAGIDETNIFTGGNTCLEWGIIDIWRRRKPEHYMTRKAYSPIVLPKAEAVKLNNDILQITVENRFCHTNLSETKIHWECGELSGYIYGPDVAPREEGSIHIVLPAAPEETQDTIELSFIDSFGNRVDEYRLPIVGQGETKAYTEAAMAGKSVSCRKDEKHILEDGDQILKDGEHILEDEEHIHEDKERIFVEGDGFTFTFSKATGLLEHAASDGQTLLVGGPYMNVPYLRLGAWSRKNMKITEGNGQVTMVTSGRYGQEMEVTFTIDILSDGTIKTAYTIDRLYVKLPKQIKLRVGVDCGGLDELGVYYLADPSLDTLSWKRKGLWTIYPEEHIARCEGTAGRRSPGSTFGVEPEIPWSQEMKNYILNGRYDVDYRGTMEFRSLKEHIYEAGLRKEGSKCAVKAVSDGSHSLRLEVIDPEDRIISDRDERIRYVGEWHPMEDTMGSLKNTEMWSNQEGSYAECTFRGTGVVWYGPVDTIYGIAKVSIDGKLMDDNISQRVNGVDFPGSAAGYDKKYRYPLYSITGLKDGEHTIRIEATGRKANDAKNSYIVIDYLRIIGKEGEEPIRFIINNDYNYPHIAWGNYSKPAILIEDGYSNYVTMKLGR